MMSIRSLAEFNRSSLGGDGDWLTPPPSPPRPRKPGRHGERGMGTFNWPPARTSTWPYTGTFSWPRTFFAIALAGVLVLMRVAMNREHRGYLSNDAPTPLARAMRTISGLHVQMPER